MIDNHHVELTNQKSFVNQKFNLRTTEENEIFLIPSFTLIATPIISAQNLSCYELFFQIAYAYCENSTIFESERGTVSNLIFQYDLNFSNIKEARGQIKIVDYSEFIFFKNSKVTRTLFDITGYKNKTVTQYLPSLSFILFKILLPIKAVAKDSLNILHYSFNATKSDYFRSGLMTTNKNWHINNKNNSGTLTFYINNNPKYQLQIAPKMLSKEINILSIKNPLIFQTFIPKIDDKYQFNIERSDITFFGIVKAESLVDENFQFIFNNFNTFAIFPLKIQHYLNINNLQNDLKVRKLLDFLNNFIIHQSEFNLQQDLSLNIIDHNKNLEIKKITANLLAANQATVSQEYFNFKQYFLKFNSEIYLPLKNKFINQIPFPYNQKLNFVINMPFIFKTFFKYDINFNLVEHTNSAIIGDGNNLITTKITNKNFSDVKWVQKDKIILSYNQIKQYYINNNFNFDDYQSLVNVSHNYAF